MRIRDSFAVMNGDKTECEIPSGGLQIIADDGRTLFEVKLNSLNCLEISGGMVCKNQGILLDDEIYIVPRSANRVWILRDEYKEQR